jgi:4-amino-4-deoxy-L-arabinose transferase-like glycosyltransferase
LRQATTTTPARGVRADETRPRTSRPLNARLESVGARRAALAAVLLVYLALAAGSALTRRPWSDEAWFANPAWNLATKGFMGTTVLRTGEAWLQGIERRTYWVMPLGLLAEAAWFKLFGFGLFTTRLLSAAWGALALGACYVFVKRLSGDAPLALLTVALLAVDYVFISAASFGRMDMMSAALGLSAYAAYAALRERNLLAAVFAAQSLTCLSGLTHPHGGTLTFLGLIFVTLYLDRARLGWRHLAVAAAPYLVGALGWGAYVAQEPQTFLAQFKGNATTGGRASTLTHPWLGLKWEITRRYATAYGLGAHSAGHRGPIMLKSLVLVAYACAVAGVLAVRRLRAEPYVRVLLALVAVHFVALSIVDGQKLYYYLVHIVPLYTALLAVFLLWCWRRRAMPRLALLLAASALLAVQAGGLLYRMKVNTMRQGYAPAVAFLREHTTPQTLIMASGDIGFGLGFDRNLVDDTRLGYHTGVRPEVIVVEEIYGENFKGWRASEPALAAHVARTLAGYDLVHDAGGYQIYFAKGVGRTASARAAGGQKSPL